MIIEILYGVASALAMGAAVWFSSVKLCEPPLDRKRALYASAAFAAIGLIRGCSYHPGDFYAVHFLRLIMAMSCLAGAAVCDFREKKIPDLFSVMMIGAFFAACMADSIRTPENGAASLLGGLLAGGILWALLMLFRGVSLLFFRQAGIGMGDIKILTALGCLIGLYGALGTLLLGQIAALIFSLGLLALRKANLRDTIPFAPFMFVGFIASSFLDVF